MPYLLTKEYLSFDELPIADRVIILRRELDALAQTDLAYLKLHPDTPSLYEWAPKYKIKPRPFVPGINNQTDVWQDIPSIMSRGDNDPSGIGPDCKDLCAWRMGELYRHYKGPFGFHVKVQQVGDLIVYHIQIEGYNPDGTFCREDPSRLLGMPSIVSPAQLSAIMNG